MKPYYQEDGITIYHGDCRDILPSIQADSIITDPPYGINLHRNWISESSVGIVGDDIKFDPSILMRFGFKIIWGANNFCDLLPIGGWICWDKRCSVEADRMYGSPFELAWCSDSSKFKMYRCLHGGVVNADGPNEKRFHPTQKPISLMEFCISLNKLSVSVLDPFMGSGTTLRAAKNLGLTATGIEIEEKYCEIAAKRLSQKVLQFT